MPPRPIKGDLPDLSDEFLDVLRAMWTFVADVCIVIWTGVCQVFETVWPFFEGFWNELGAALIGLMDYVVTHPGVATTLFVLFVVVVGTALGGISMTLSYCLGESERDMLRNSYGTNYQSTNYGRNAPRAFVGPQSRQGVKGGGGSRPVGGTGPSSWN